MTARSLNNNTWRILLKRGLQADVATAAANGVFDEAELFYATDTHQVYIEQASDTYSPVGGPRIPLAGITANTTASIFAGYVIDDIFIYNNTANAVTGGLKIGTTNGGTEVATSLAVAANCLSRVMISSLNTTGPFSTSAAQTIYIQAVTAWNSANLDIIICLKRGIV